MRSSTCMTMVGFYTSMRSSTCTRMVGFTLQWQALHFLKSLLFHISNPPPHSQFSSSSHWFMTSKSASSFTQGKDLSHGLYWNHAHAWLCLVWALVPVRPQALPTTYSHQNQPSMRCIPKPLKWISHFLFDLLINFPLSQLRVSLPIFHCRKFSSQATNIWWLFQKVIRRTN